VQLDDRPGDAAFDAELRRLHRRLYARDPDPDERDEAAAHWEAAAAAAGPAAAWASLVSVWLRDPAFWTR
jgi:hypothetical protein